MRNRFTGVSRIVRFNWPYFIFALVSISIVLVVAPFLPPTLAFFARAGGCIAALTTLLSLLASWYAYDLSDLYSFEWLELPRFSTPCQAANIHAGFDETSRLLRERFDEINLRIFDFYNSEHHTEASIRRARRAFPASPDTVPIATTDLPLADKSLEVIFLMLAAHEIRDEAERILFFQELRRVATPEARLYVVEHLRDWKNFVAYTVGFLHFHSDATWRRSFQKAGWQIESVRSLNTLITCYTLK